MSDAAERYARLHAIFDAVRELSGDERAARLDAECDGDATLRADVLRLLAATDAPPADDAFSDSRIDAGRDAIMAIARDAAPSAGPERIGDYRIVRRVAEGGMGVVYEAMQESPRRRVALKLLRPTHATPDHLRRFRQEAELLGRLQHPGIAQVHEAGTHDLGEGAQPFFAMEFVDGVDLRAYCDRAQLDSRERLEVLARVCDAVDYAHQRGVIHRDLKPENILVDGHDVPKVLDFGIARTTDDSTLVATRVTQDGQLLGTLAYMAPEQLEGAQECVSPRTDVYALGVMAFELLAGRPTHDVSGLSLAAAVRHLSDDDVPALGTIDTRLRGDVETIVATAVEKEPGRRYASAAALATDIRRFLDDQPILARPASRMYRVRKFARRNRAVVIGGAATIVTLVAGLVVALVLGASERRQRLATDRLLYQTSMLAATQALAEHRPEAAAQHLDNAPVDQRGWEWRELSARIDPAAVVFEVEPQGIKFVLASPDGTWFLTSGDDGFLRTWDAVTGAARLAIETPQSRGPCFPFLRNGGREIVALGAPGRADGAAPPRLGWLAVWNEHGRRVLHHEIDRRTGATGITPDGRTLIQCSDDRIVMIDIETGATSFSPPLVFPDRPGELFELHGRPAVSPDGATLAVGDWSGAVHLFSYPQFERLARLEGHTQKTPWVTFSADGRRLATASADGTALLWDVTTDPPRRIAVMEGEGELGRIRTIAFSADGNLLVTPCQDRTVRVWDGRTGQPRRALVGHEAEPKDATFLPGGTGLLSVARNQVLSWNLTTMAGAELQGHRGYVYGIAPTPDGRTLLTGGWDGLEGHPASLHWWDVDTRTIRDDWGEAPEYAVSVAVSADGRRAAVALRSRPVPSGRVVFFDLANRHELGSVESLNRALAIDFDPGGRRAVLAGETETVKIVDVDTMAILAERRVASHSRAAWSADGTWIAVSTGDVEIELWDGDTFDVVRRWAAHERHINQVHFDAEGGRLVTTSADGSAGVWDVATGEQLARLLGHGTPLGAAFSPDGTRIATCGRDGLIRIWETHGYTQVGELRGHEGYVYCVAWSPDGQTLYSGGEDGVIRVWGPRSGD